MLYYKIEFYEEYDRSYPLVKTIYKKFKTPENITNFVGHLKYYKNRIKGDFTHRKKDGTSYLKVKQIFFE